MAKHEPKKLRTPVVPLADRAPATPGPQVPIQAPRGLVAQAPQRVARPVQQREFIGRSGGRETAPGPLERGRSGLDLRKRAFRASGVEKAGITLEQFVGRSQQLGLTNLQLGASAQLIGRQLLDEAQITRTLETAAPGSSAFVRALARRSEARGDKKAAESQDALADSLAQIEARGAGPTRAAEAKLELAKKAEARLQLAAESSAEATLEKIQISRDKLTQSGEQFETRGLEFQQNQERLISQGGLTRTQRKELARDAAQLKTFLAEYKRLTGAPGRRLARQQLLLKSKIAAAELLDVDRDKEAIITANADIAALSETVESSIENIDKPGGRLELLEEKINAIIGLDEVTQEDGLTDATQVPRVSDIVARAMAQIEAGQAPMGLEDISDEDLRAIVDFNAQRQRAAQ